LHNALIKKAETVEKYIKIQKKIVERDQEERSGRSRLVDISLN